MLDLLAASYKNIGPLYNRTVSLCFHKGTYLIKAPVGIGKSFLFFDGPIFSLYKHAPRPIRNRRSHEAYTQVLFMVEDQVWLIHRMLTPTKKGGDSVKSILYSLDIGGDEVIHLLSKYETFFDEPLVDLLEAYIERVDFTNEKELDATLLDLLPPKEVVLSAHFLMQDADNIFELAPGDRLEVFKHIFGFIGIDHAKEQLREKRKEIQTTIMVKGDVSDLQRIFTTSLIELKKNVSSLQEQRTSDVHIQKHVTSFLSQDLFHDIKLLDNEIQLNGFVCDVDESPVDGIVTYIQEQYATHTRLQAKKEEAEKYYHILQQEKKDIQQQIQQLSADQKHIEEKIAPVQQEDIHQLELQAKEQEEHASGKEKEYMGRCSKLGYAVTDFVSVVRVVDDIRAQGKQLQLKIHNTEKERETLKNHHKNIEKRQIDLEQQLTLLQQSYEEQAIFRCDKIEGDCPYVEVIKGSSLRALSQQKTTVQQQILEVRELIKENEIKIQKNQQVWEDMSKEKEKHLAVLIALDRKMIYKEYESYQNLQHDYKKTRERIDQYQKQQTAVVQQKQDLQNIQTQKKLLQSQMGKQQEPEKEYTITVDRYTKQIQHIDVEELTLIENYLLFIRDIVQRLHNIMEQYEKRYKEIALLEEQQKQLKQLYTIFSKELLIVVLQDFLPIIESTINSYLVEVAEYTLLFELEYTASDTVNLEIYVEDNKGKRAVKSLSGGQKSLLKLAWIFSIATMLQLPFLFLDETITSLDAVTTSHVADVLHRFVQQFTTKLYVITHSPQIQDMHIRDKEIQIDS